MFINKFLKKYKICTLAIVIAGFSSCDSELDINPITQVSVSNFFSNNDELQLALTGTYNGYRRAYRQNHIVWGELRSDNHMGVGGNANAILPSNNITVTNGGARWNTLYSALFRVNQVIAGGSKFEGADPNILAQAYAMRSNLYFNAIRVWGDVPLYTEPTDVGADDIFRSRIDRDDIMRDVIIPDMLRAESLSTINTNDFGFSESSILAHQAEVYMWNKDYENAKIALNKFFALGSHSFVRTPQEWEDMFFNEGAEDKRQTGSELIMSLKFDPSEENGQGNSNRSGIAQIFKAGSISLVMSPSVENKWRQKFPLTQEEWEEKYPETDPVVVVPAIFVDEEGNETEGEVFAYGDWRYYTTRFGGVAGIGSLEIGEARTGKWSDAIFTAQDDVTDIVLYRYADMFLLLAEAELHTGNSTTAFEMINTFRRVRSLPAVTDVEFGTSFDENLDFILDERQLELFGEGKRWWDLVRNNRAVQTINDILTESSEVNEANLLTIERLLWPIHVEHTTDNPNITQNTGY